MMITSFSNPKIKAIRKLEERKARQETGFLIEGLRTVAKQFRQPLIETLVIAPQLLISTFGPIPPGAPCGSSG